MKTHFSLVAAALALAGCASPNASTFNQEAGAQLDRGFGDATMNNTLAQTNAAEYRINLQRRFEAEVNAMVTFPFDSAALDGTAQAILIEQANWIKQFPEIRFKVFGHTDLVGSSSYNQRLGQQRANAVVNFLVGQGVNRSRLEAVVSFGEQRPLVVTEGRERQNRRTVTEVTGFVENHPTLLNGKYAEVIFREYVQSAQPQNTATATTVTEGG